MVLFPRWSRKPAPPERSISLRRWVFSASLAPILAVAWVGWLWGPALLSGLVLVVGHYYSWRAAQREAAQPLARLAVFVALHLALLYMCAGFFAGVRLPQAQFALYAQAITSFDLRRRLNLLSSLGLSLIILYVAATLGRDYSFFVFILLFVILALPVFYRAEIEDGAHGARLKVQGSTDKVQGSKDKGQGLSDKGHAYRTPTLSYWTTTILRPLASFSLSVSLFSFLVFAFTPHFAARPLIPPFSLNLPIPRGPTAQVLNPAVPLVQINGVYEPDQEGDYYYGFDSQLDLRYRGGLSDAVVMYVRSPAWSYWRSHAYDDYDGHAWSQSEKSLRPVERLSRLGVFRIPADAQALGEEVAQTYYIVRDQPNLLVAAYRPVEAYLSSPELVLDADDGLRVGAPLVAGTVYTIVSRRPDFSEQVLRAASADYPAEVTDRYLQLPEDISARVRDLARRLTAEAPTPYDKASALRAYLLTLRYDFFPPPQPPNTEAVDNFLFVDRRGVCEQFVTAHVVMLRSLGIPARLAAGYGAGEYNPLSGYYTVRASDAHAWTEVYFPGYGWVPFDPTPGWTPAPYTAPVQQWIFSARLDNLPALPWGAVASAGSALLGAALPSLSLVLVALVVAGVAWLLSWAWRAARRKGAAEYPGIDRDPNRRRILAAYRQGQMRLRRFRAPAQTPREFALRIARPEWDELTAAAQRAAYDVRPPPPALARRAQELLSRLTAAK